MKEFNLSEQMMDYTYDAKQDVFFLEDVKEFIKRLKDDVADLHIGKYTEFIKILKKLAGDKLKWDLDVYYTGRYGGFIFNYTM